MIVSELLKDEENIIGRDRSEGNNVYNKQDLKKERYVDINTGFLCLKFWVGKGRKVLRDKFGKKGSNRKVENFVKRYSFL